MQIYTYITRKKDIFFITQQYLKTFYKECWVYKKEQIIYIYFICFCKLWQLRFLQQLLKSHILIREWDIAIASDFTLLRDPAFDLYTHIEAHDFLWLYQVGTTVI